MFSRLLLAVLSPLAAVLLVSAMLTGCAGMSGASLPVGETQPGQTAAYRLGVGDKLKIAVFGEENLSGQFEVNPTGNIALPLAGEMPAQGMTVAELREQLSRRLKDGYLKHPKVTVDVVNYRPIYVHGEVRTGGEVPYKSGMRLRDAIALAGGYTYRADESYVSLGRGGAAERAVRMTGESPLLPGDNIRVPERIF